MGQTALQQAEENRCQLTAPPVHRRADRCRVESATLGSPCQQSMEIRRGSTANESISLQRESATGHCGRKWQIRRRDVRTAAICKAMLKTRTSVVADLRLRYFGLRQLTSEVEIRIDEGPPTLRSTIPSGSLRDRWLADITLTMACAGLLSIAVTTCRPSAASAAMSIGTMSAEIGSAASNCGFPVATAANRSWLLREARVALSAAPEWSPRTNRSASSAKRRATRLSADAGGEFDLRRTVAHRLPCRRPRSPLRL